MDCLLGNFTGHPYIPWENTWFPVKISHRRGLHRLFWWLPWQQRFLLYELLQTLQNYQVHSSASVASTYIC